MLGYVSLDSGVSRFCLGDHCCSGSNNVTSSWKVGKDSKRCNQPLLFLQQHEQLFSHQYLELGDTLKLALVSKLCEEEDDAKFTDSGVFYCCTFLSQSAHF